jgi:hypothetical protein
MSKSLRLALFACAGFAGLAFAGPALASSDPSLTVEQSSYKLGAPFTADLFIATSRNDDPTAKLTIFAPAGYGVNLNKAPGTRVGSAIALAKVAKLGVAPVGLAGPVVVVNPADPTIMATSTSCTGSPTNQAVLVLNLAGQGLPPLSFPMFVNKVGPLTTFQVCLPHPDISPTNPSGARILLLDATVKRMLTNPATPSPSGYEWSTLFMPYSPTKARNPAGTIEWRTYVGLPEKLTLTRAKSKKGFKLTGRVSIAGLNPAGIRINLYAGKKPHPAPNATSLGTGKPIARTGLLKANGKFSFTRPPVKSATFFEARLEGYGTDECPGPSPSGQPYPCKGEDIAAITSNQVKVTKPKKKRH